VQSNVGDSTAGRVVRLAFPLDADPSSNEQRPKLAVDVAGIERPAELRAEDQIQVFPGWAGPSRVGYSWAEIASRLGITRQAAQQRWGNSAA
jgi:hypothetical protein